MDYEKMGAFYLGRLFDPSAGEPKPELLLYDAKDLTTHAVCVGMTGSGKTGLCVCLLEEAAIDKVPVIAIDPKGDLGNLMLTFPKLRPEDFEPWIDPGDAARKGRTVPEHAQKTADLWRGGLASWDQDGKRIQRLKDSADVAIYTPGSNAGLPLTVLRSFDAPSAALLDDAEALAERVLSAVSGLLALLGIDADPIRSREHIFLSNVVTAAWRAGRDLAITDLIRDIQQPSFDKVGVLDLETFFPSADRFALAMSLNNLLASPSFASWMEGEPLDIQRLMWTPEGKPRISILSIAHLDESQRMFFVTLVLNELVAWMRSQPGTSSLRALLYMDEVFGYFPPTANPPSKTPMLTLLKQARAYGLGCVLATQNPVDLDYKGLSNTGTWFLGRLQTERDKMRVLEGLEGASLTAGSTFDRQKMEATLAGLSSRVFLMNNVHEDEPALFHTRWAMSYLRGPMTRAQIRTLMADRKDGSEPVMTKRAPRQPAPKATQKAGGQKPVLPPEIPEFAIPIDRSVPSGEALVYRPALLGAARLHFVSARDDVDSWSEACLLAPLDADNADPWEDVDPREHEPSLERDTDSCGRFAELPKAASRKTSYKRWGTRLKDHLYRTQAITLWRCKDLKEVSEPGESEGDFRARLVHAAREKRDLEVEKLRRKYAPKLKRIKDRMLTAEQRIEREESQYKHQKMSSMLSVGATILGALFGRKVASSRTVGRATTAARSASRAAREKADIGRAKEKLQALERQLVELEEEFEEATEAVRDSYDPDLLELDERRIKPRKSDIEIERVALVWTPWSLGADGIADPLFDR